jgi:Ser/Thr protein kinase RdoA (MazF antagonist)
LDELLLPLYRKLEPWLPYLRPLWTHNDFHASNLTWSGFGEDAEVLGIIDFGLADRTNAVHDLATAIERNIVEWLRIAEPEADVVHLDHLDALLAGYEEICPLSHEEAQALVAMLPLVHCEFALSETDYFLSILHSPEKAYLAYEGYFLAHAQWFETVQGRRLLAHMERWAGGIAREPSKIRLVGLAK